MNFVTARQQIFVDAGAWIAHSNPRDPHHERAIEIYAALRQRKVKLLTTDYVIDEAITRLRYDVNHRIAVQFLDFVHDSVTQGELELKRIGPTLFEKAEGLFRERREPSLSFTDCTSFVMCREEKIGTAFGFDRHFIMMKINLLN